MGTWFFSSNFQGPFLGLLWFHSEINVFMNRYCEHKSALSVSYFCHP
jgi:hypothetical protein